MVTRDDVVPLLAASPLFAGLAPAELASVAGELEEQHYLRGNRIVLEGMRGLEFFVIVDGRAAVESHGCAIASLGPGDFFGEVAAVDGGSRTATVRASSQLRCLTLPGGTLTSFLDAHPRVAVNLANGVARRVRTAAGKD